MSQRKRARKWTEKQATDLLRGRILSGIHGGHLEAGDRLPTYREVSEETGLDLRAVAQVYRTLVEEGLVQIRGKRGVFVAPQERLGGLELPSEISTARVLAPNSAGDLAELLLRFNVQAMEKGQ